MLERAKSSILPNGNFREFFLWRGGEFCVFKTGIPGGPEHTATRPDTVDSTQLLRHAGKTQLIPVRDQHCRRPLVRLLLVQHVSCTVSDPVTSSPEPLFTNVK